MQAVRACLPTVMLTAKERWAFDHQRFITLPQAVPPEDVQRTLALSGQWLDSPEPSGSESGLPQPLTLSSPPPGTEEYRKRPRWINNVHYADGSFARAASSPE